MKPIRMIVVAVLIVGSVLALPVAQAQLPGVTRTASEVVAPNRNPPGEELVYVIEGVIQYQLEGQPPVRC